jgi:hypothetical protein
VAGPRPGGADQGGEEADGLSGLLLAEGDEVRFCQLDLLVHTITGRLSITKPGRSNPAFGPLHIVSDRTPRFLAMGVLAYPGLGGDSAGVPTRSPRFLAPRVRR